MGKTILRPSWKAHAAEYERGPKCGRHSIGYMYVEHEALLALER